MHPVPDGSLWSRADYVCRMYWGHVLTGRWGGIFRSLGKHHPEVNAAQCVSIGPIVKASHFQPHDRGQARAALGVEPDVPCVALLSGSLGGQCLVEWTRALQRSWQGKLTVVNVCGRSEQVRARVQAIAQQSGDVRVLPLGFVEDMATVYAAADAVIARPSAGVVGEALRHRRPLVLPSYAMANDLGCLQLVRQFAAGEVYDSLDDLGQQVRRVISSPEVYGQAIDRLLAPYPASFDALKARIRELLIPPEGACTA